MSVLKNIFSKSKNTDELILIFDVGSASVGGAFFYMQKNGVPKIILSTRESIVVEENLDIDKFFLNTIKALKLVAGKMCMSGFGAPSRIFCVLSSPWYISQTRIIKLEKNTPFIFNNKLADSLIQKEIAFFEEEYMIKDHNKNKIQAIELKNMKTVLNGYATRFPINQKAKELQMTIFLSMSEDFVLNKIREVINTHFHMKEIKFSSFAMASFTVARDMFINQENFLLINIGGEVTDIAMIKKDVVSEATSYPAGLNFIIREVAKESKSTLEEAKSFISLQKDGHMDDATAKKLEPIINKAKSLWLLKFQESLNNLTNDISIPATVFITIDRGFVDFFSEIIKTEQFNQYTLTESKFRIIFLGIETLHGIAVFDGEVNRDPFLIIESIYINRFLR